MSSEIIQITLFRHFPLRKYKNESVKMALQYISSDAQAQMSERRHTSSTR